MVKKTVEFADAFVFWRMQVKIGNRYKLRAEI